MGRRSRERAERKPRERLGHERPGAVRHGPPITVPCECGERRELAYGEVWRCESCGRRWDTNQIPHEDYDRIRRLQLRFRMLPIAYGVGVSLLALFFALTGNTFSIFVLLPGALIAWMAFLRPAHRRRYREAISDLPSWTLRPS